MGYKESSIINPFLYITKQIRKFYLMPYLMGYSVMGMLSFPLESEIASQIYQIFGKK